MNADVLAVLTVLGSFAVLGALVWMCDALLERKS